MNTKNNQRVRLTKRLFHESMIRLLQKKPLYEITVSQLCSDSELNRSTFYKYYENVRDVYEELEQEAILQSETCIQGVKTIDEESVILQLEKLLSYIQEHSALYLLLLENSADGDFPYKLIHNAMEFVMHIPELLQEEWRGKEDYCFVYVISGSLTVIRKWLRDGLKESPHEIASVIYRLAINCLKID